MSKARGKNSNTFRDGLNTDMHPLDTSNKVMTDNANVTLITGEGDEYILQNMRGNELKTQLTEGFKPVAVKVFNNVSYIISQNIEDPTIGEVGTFPSPDWAELNKQIPILKDLLAVINLTSESVQPLVDVPVTFTRIKQTDTHFHGQLKTAAQAGSPDPDQDGCTVCEWKLIMNDSSIHGPYQPGASYSFTEISTGDPASNWAIVDQQRTNTDFTIDPPHCDCSNPGPWNPFPATYIENVDWSVNYIYTITSLSLYTGVFIAIDFTNSNVQGTISASFSNGIFNATQASQGFPPVDGLVIDNNTGIVEMYVGNFGTFPFFTINSTVNHFTNPVFFNPITGTRLAPESTEYIKTYDIAGLGLTTLQLGAATFSLFLSNDYPLADPNIQYKVESDPLGATPDEYQNIVLPPGTEVLLAMTGITLANTLDLYILYPGTGFGGSDDWVASYQLYITYPSVEGEICVPMIDQYAPLHNFYDYNGNYTDPLLLPVPNPPSEASLDEEGYYVAPLRTPSFNFDNINFVDLELQPSYDRSVNIVFTDNKNKPRLINSRFIVKEGNKEATIADRQGSKDTNIYSNERWGSVDLILTSETIARLDFDGLVDGGNMLPGGYKFYFVYANSDLQTTNTFTESRLVQVFKGEGDSVSGGAPDERIGKSVKFTLSGLDTKFLYVKVFYARDMGEFSAGSFELREVFNLFPITTGGNTSILVTGFELTINRAQNYLETQFSDLSAIQTLTAIQGSLALGNAEIDLKNIDYLRALCAQVKIGEAESRMGDMDPNNPSTSLKRTPYIDPKNTYYRLGYWPGETYEVGIVFKMAETNLLSPVIPIRGIDNFDGTAVYTGSAIYEGTGFIAAANDSNNTRENTNGVYRTKEARAMASFTLGDNSPNIIYLEIDLSVLALDPKMQEITDGFFIVRKQRIKDCQYEGLLSHAQSVPLSDPIIGIDILSQQGTTLGIGSMANNNGDFNIAGNSSTGGSPVKRDKWPAKYIPMPGTLWNTAYPTRASTTSNPKYYDYTQFLNRGSDVAGEAVSARDMISHLSFYTPDIMTRPTDVASFFSGTSRGLRYNDKKVFLRPQTTGNLVNIPLIGSNYINISGRDGELDTNSMVNYQPEISWDYITAGQESVTPETFSALVRNIQTRLYNEDGTSFKNDYGYVPLVAEDTVDGPNSSGRTFHKFDDFVGMEVIDGDNSILKNLLEHETTLAGTLKTPGDNGPDPGNNAFINNNQWYTESAQNKMTLGILARIYHTIEGPISMGTNWQAKYQSTTNSGYFAITDRYSWKRLSDEGAVLEVFEGDRFIGEMYKRINYKVGIQGDPAATNAGLYGDEAAGLEDAGMTLAFICSSSTNFSIRSEQFKDAAEKLIYGNDRRFYPLYSLSTIRTLKQLDSKLYYSGFNLEAAALTNTRLTVELPALVDSFPYRIMLSAPADLTSFTNGYRDFSGLNFRDYDSAFGQIIKLVAIQSQLFVIWEYGIGRVYTQEKTMVTDEDGGVYVDQASRLHPQAQVISNKYGSTDPYSIIKTADAIYGIDWTDNKIWRISATGEFALISDFRVERLLTKVKDDLTDNNIVHKFYAGYDSFNRNVFFNYSGYNNGSPTPIGSIYYNETLKVWISKLTFYPYFIFNIRENWYSYNFDDLDPVTAGQIWQHNSDNGLFCNFYGEQHAFEYEFILVDNPARQKILNNLKIISTEEYPLTVTYGIVDKHNYETNAVREESFIDRLIKRFKQVTAVMREVVEGSPYLLFEVDPGLLAGEHIVVNNGTKYEIQDIIEYQNFWYVYVRYVDPITGISISTVSQAYDGSEPVVINNGIIRENILYKEDHFYIVVGNKFITLLSTVGGGVVNEPEEEQAAIGFSGLDPRFIQGSNRPNPLGLNFDRTEIRGPGEPIPVGSPGGTISTAPVIISEIQKSAPRDKYIRIKLRYKGDKQVFIQAVESLFTYSYS